MKKLQKVIGIILVIMLISVQLIPIINVSAEETETLTITTYGENEDGIRSDLVTNTAALTVNNITNGDTLSAYKIIDTFYNRETNEITYEFTSDFQTFLDQSTNETYKNMTVEDYYGLTSDNEDGSASTSVITSSTLNALVSNYTTYLRANSTITGIDMTTTDTTATAEVPAGAYLILPKTILNVTATGGSGNFGFKRNLYGVMVGNVVFTVNETNNQWELNDNIIYSKKEENILLSSLGGFSFSEYVDVMNGNIQMEDVDFNFYQSVSSYHNRKLFYFLEVGKTQFPTNAINKVHQIEIVFPEGISYDIEIVNSGSSLIGLEIVENQIIDLNTQKILGTLVTNSQSINIEINLENIQSIEFSNFNFAFDVMLNEKAVVGDLGNKITMTLTTAADPYVANELTTITTTNTITTYGLELTSYGEENTDGTKPLLTGAKYEIYTTYTDSVLSNKIGEFTVGEDGKATFTGVPSGTIYLKQTKAPTGYQLIKDPIEVEIATENAIVGSDEGYYQTSTTNTAMWYLPTTGGIGTIIYTVIGLAIITIATAGVIYYRKKSLNS